MYRLIVYIVLINEGLGDNKKQHLMDENIPMINVVDLTKATTWKELSEYYIAVEKHWYVELISV